MEFAPKHPVPVLPLPGLVLFPHAMIPLHIFELRYRTMVRDALSGERLIAMALLKPGWERDYHGSPEFFGLGCLARFEEVHWLPNDCYELKVAGLARARIQRVTSEYPYRAARLQLLPQEPYSEDDPLIHLEKRALLATFMRWRSAATSPQEGEPPSLPEDLAYEPLVNGMCMFAEAGPLEKLELLELDSVIERGRRVRELIERRLRKPERPQAPGGEQN